MTVASEELVTHSLPFTDEAELWIVVVKSGWPLRQDWLPSPSALPVLGQQ